MSRRLAARHASWAAGTPGDYLYDANQRGWVDRIVARDTASPTVWCVGRQVGKSYGWFAFAHEVMLQVPGAIARYCAKTKDSAWAIAGPNLERIWADCPPEVRPRPNPKKTDELVMPHNGSTLTIFGTDAQSFDKGRGPVSHLIGMDECGFYQDLEGVEAALLPSLQTAHLPWCQRLNGLPSGGLASYLSTPSDSPAHPYSQRVQAARARQTLEHATIYDNPRVDVEAVIRSECERLGLTRDELLRSTYWRREYLAEWVTEESRAALPAWNSELHRRVVKEWPKPQYFTSYVSIDWGGHEGDPHAALFGYVDFKSGKLIIEDEFERHGGTLTELAFAWKEKERKLWGVDGWDGTLAGAYEWTQRNGELPPYLALARKPSTRPAPYLRVCDSAKADALQTTLSQEHGYTILATAKPDKHLHVDGLNSYLAAERIVIHPRCVRLIEQCYSTLWDVKRQRWERTPKDHGDLVDCFVYMARNVSWNRDPFPVPVPVMWEPPKPAHPAVALSGRAIRVKRY